MSRKRLTVPQCARKPVQPRQAAGWDVPWARLRAPSPLAGDGPLVMNARFRRRRVREIPNGWLPELCPPSAGFFRTADRETEADASPDAAVHQVNRSRERPQLPGNGNQTRRTN